MGRMMKKLLLSTAILLGLTAQAFAVCAVTNLQVKDNAGTTANVPYADDGSGGTNCSPQIQIKQGGNVAVVKAGNAAATTDIGMVVADPNVLAAVQSSIPAGTATIGNTGLVAPAGATQETASATGTTLATTATLATAVGKTTYICGFSIRANATAAATGNATVTGTITGTLNYTQWTAPNASGIGVTEMIFLPCIPASAANTSIAVVSAAPGTGGVVSVTAWGYQQ